MQHVAILGDSHSAALKHGWAKIADDFPDFRLTFFSGASENWNTVDASGDHLITTSDGLRAMWRMSSKGQEEIPATFDAYIVLGLGLRISRLLSSWVMHREKSDNGAKLLANLAVQPSSAAKILGSLRSITQKPALLIASPFQPEQFSRHAPNISDIEGAELNALFFEACDALAQSHSATFIKQPKATIALNRVTTLSIFANQRSASERPDLVHCNAEYGRRILKRALKRLAVSD